MLTGNNGIITQTENAKIMNELSSYKEQLELYKLEKVLENTNFSETTLTAGQSNLIYNTQADGEIGNIKTVIPNISDNYFEQIEIIKGELIINTQDKKVISVAQSLDIQVNPYQIEEGELLSSTGNLLLMDANRSLTIPDTVTKIGEGAFANLEGLKTIIIPGTVKEIAKNAFAYNTTLETVIIKEGVEIIGESAFKGCTNLVTIELPETLTEIKVIAFNLCTNLQSIEIPSKIKIINNMTFAGCSNLSKIIFRGNALTKIGKEAFFGCAISEFRITENVTSIDSTAFSKCNNLLDIKIEANENFKYENKMLLTKNKEDILFLSIKYYQDSTELTVPSGVKNFVVDISNLSKLKKLNIPSSLESVYQRCLPTGIEEIIVEEGNNNFKISNNCLYSKNGEELIFCYSKEQNIVIEEGTLILRDYSFRGATKATMITLPDSLTTIKNQVFSEITKIQEIKIGKKVSSIDPMFKYYNYYGTVTIDSENPYYMIENNTLYSKDKKTLYTVLYKIEGEYVVDSGIEEIQSGAFYSQNKMTKINLPKGLKELKGRAFNSCGLLVSIEIPNSVTSIGTSCFSGCSNLDSIIINNSQDSISGVPWDAPKGMKVVNWNG